MVTHGKRKKKKKCFVVSAISKPKSAVRKRANTVLKDIIKFALDMSNVVYKVERIDIKGEAGDITEGIIDLLRIADLVVVDLTDLNPNVMYEMGIRQAWCLPLIPIIEAEQLSSLPFDVQVLNTIPYSLKTRKGKQDAIVGIRKQLKSILLQEQKDAVFARAMSLVGKKYSMDSVYSSFSDALTDADHAVFHFKHELPNTLNFKDDETIENFSANLRRAFVRLSDKLYVFEQIARGRPGEYTDENILSLIADARKCLRKADNIDRILMSKRTTSDKNDKVTKMMDSTMQIIDKVAKKIQTKRKLMAYK